jgi:hypothetical protein
LLVVLVWVGSAAALGWWLLSHQLSSWRAVGRRTHERFIERFIERFVEQQALGP